MTEVGFLGLGAMGSAMAGRLIAAGHDVLVWNRSAQAAAPLVAAGARLAGSAAEALARPVSFSMLANDSAVESVFDEEAIEAAVGNVHVMTASISPSLAERLSERVIAAGARYVSAPVLGRPPVAAAGRLNILAAGEQSSIDEVQPLLDVLGARTWRVSDRPEVANVVKAAVNYNIIHAMQAIGESVAMTERQGVDPALFVEMLESTLFGGVVYGGYGRIIAEQQYHPPGFHVALGRKDLRLAEEVAQRGGVTLPTMPALARVFDAALADADLRDGDWSVIAEVTRRDILGAPDQDANSSA